MKRLIVIAGAALLAVLAGSTGAQAAGVVGPVPIGDQYKSQKIRVYSVPDRARNHAEDGVCFWGEKHKNDYACTVDATTGERLEVTAAWGIPHGYRASTGERATKTIWHRGRHITAEYSSYPYFNRQLPYCLPEWVERKAGYHALRNGVNRYFCAFWKL
ncbi:hypothetical protein [Lentzea sp. HUAS12]|uniref:hypothetical protein n=1 Tax=Lentzea sp. HUAS12 TaxID=2951806 RepID=UPI00209E46E3|nr:hypothetical protein [Lentzea sp. HUAS12]USX56266.1 hypothetical protein ND450_19835 [Lentzea sp. HUAS12]